MLNTNLRAGLSADEPFKGSTAFGEDPFVVPDDGEERFSAWDYAKERCREMCGK